MDMEREMTTKIRASEVEADPPPPSPPAAASTQAPVNVTDSSGLTKASAIGAKSGSGYSNGGWDYPPPVASPVGRLLVSSNNCNKIWYPLPIEWRTPQRLFTLHPSSSSSPFASTSTEPPPPAAASSTTSVDPRDGGARSGDSAASTTSNAATTAASTTASVPATDSSATMSSSGSTAGTIAGSDLSGDSSSNTPSKKKNTMEDTSSVNIKPPVRSTLCAPIIILQNKFVLVAVNEDTLVLYGNFDTHHHHQQQQDELRSDSDAYYNQPTSNEGNNANEDGKMQEEEEEEGSNNYDGFFPLPKFSTTPLVQCSLASLVLEEVEGKKKRNGNTTAAAAAATMDIVEWNIVQMVWIEESNTLYVLMDDSYILKLHIHPPSLSTLTSSTCKPTPSIELEQYWMSENLGVTCMAVQHCSQSTAKTVAAMGDDGTNTDQYSPVDMLYLGFETGMVEGWRVHHHQLHGRQIHSSPNSDKRNDTITTSTSASSTSVSQSSSPKASSSNNRGSPTISRRPSYSSGSIATSNKNKTFVGPSASSLMLSSRRPSFNNKAEDEKYQEGASFSPPVLMWTGSFTTPTTISSLAVLPKMKTGPKSVDEESTCDEEPVRTDTDASSVESRSTKEKPIELPDDGMAKSTKISIEDKSIARENSFASIHSVSGSTTAGKQPSSSPHNSPYTRRSIILPPTSLPRPPSFVSPSTSKDMDVNHNTNSLPAAFLVVVTIQRRLRPPSGNEDDSDQPTSSMVQFLDLQRIVSDSMDGTSAPAIPSPRTTTGETTGKALAAGIGAKTMISLLDYAVIHSPSMDLIDSSTAIFENQDGRLPKPSRTMDVRGADLTTMILPSSLSTGDDSNMNIDGGRDHAEGQQGRKQQEGVKVGVMLPDGTAAILSSTNVSNGNDDHSFVGLHNEYHQFLLPFPAIGTGTVTIRTRNISSESNDVDQQQFLVCCVRGGTCYLLPTSSIHNDQRTSPSIIKRRIRRPIHAYAFPHDVDTDLASIYVQSFTAGSLVIDSSESKVPVMLFSSPGGTVDIYSCDLLPKLSSTRSSLGKDEKGAPQSIIHGNQSGEDSDDFHFLPREERMVLEDMIEDGTIEVFVNVVREMKRGDLERIRTVLKEEDVTKCWDDIVDIFASIENVDDILSHLEGNSVDVLSTLCDMPRMRPVRELLVSLALEKAQ